MCATVGEHSRRMLKKAAFSPAQPRHAETRRSAGKAAASEGRGGTYRTLCGPFALAMGLGERINTFRHSDLRATPSQG
jgi:hypothetical protein